MVLSHLQVASLKRKRDPQASIRVPESVRKHVQISTKPGGKQAITKSRSSKIHNMRTEFTALQTDDAGSPPKKPNSRPSIEKGKQEEKRLRLFRKKAPYSYLEKLARATSQRYFEISMSFTFFHRMLIIYGRMFILERMPGGTEDFPEETIAIAGSTGNIYNVTICQVPRCTCPDNLKGNQCKHIIYVGKSHYRLRFIADE